MNICPMCGLSLSRSLICSHHILTEDNDWHVTNRIMCNFVHRRVDLPPRLDVDELLDYVIKTSGLIAIREFDAKVRREGKQEQAIIQDVLQQEQDRNI